MKMRNFFGWQGILVAVLLLVSLLGCASTPIDDKDAIGVDLFDIGPRRASSRTGYEKLADSLMYSVSVSNLSEELITIESIELDPLDGGDLEFVPAMHRVDRLLEPGQTEQFMLLVTPRAKTSYVDPAGPSTLRIIVSLRSNEKGMVRSYSRRIKRSAA